MIRVDVWVRDSVLNERARVLKLFFPRLHDFPLEFAVTGETLKLSFVR